MRKKFTMLLALVFLTLGTSVAQVYQKIPHTKWTVTAFNQAGTVGNEGGVGFIQDENPQTFYHSNYSGSQPTGKDGLQGFMVDMGSVVSDITKITYTGRSDDNTSGWARKVRIYLYESLPDGVPADLSTVAHADKNTKFARGNAALGTAAFDNNETGEWADNRNLKTAELAEAKNARYVLFIMDSGHDNWLTCADFNVWQKVEGIVEDKPYFLEIASIEGDWYLDTKTPMNDNQGKRTIGKSETPVPTYFTLNDGYWHISTMPGNEGNYISVDQWCATPQSATAAKWTMVKNDDGSYCLLQNNYGTGSNRFLGGLADNGKVYTDQDKENAIKIRLVELNEVQTASEAARISLSHVGVGYPAVDSEARTTLQAAIDAAGATVESINMAIEAYKSNAQVLMPEVGKVYRLVSAMAKFPTKKAIYSDNVEARWQSKDAAAMNQLWTVQSIANGKIVLMNVGDAMYPQKLDAATLKMLPVEKENDLTFLGDGQFKISNMHANNHGNGAGTSGNIINYPAGRGSASAWRFEEVAVSEAVKNSLIGAVENTYINSLLIEQEGLEEAVETARANADHAAAFAGLVAAVDAANAQYIGLGYFYMKSKNGQRYAYNNGEDLKVKSEKVNQSIFKLTKADATTFYIQNGNGLYAQISSQSTQTKTAASQVKFTISKLTDGYYVLRAVESDDAYRFWHDDSNGRIVGWKADAESPNTRWTFEELTVEETEKIYTVSELNASADVHVTYIVEGYTGDKDVKQAGGFYVLDNAPTTKDFFVANVGEGMISSVVVDGKSLSVNAGYDGKNIYTLRCMKGNSYARYHSGCQLSADNATNMLTYEGQTYYESLFFIEKGTGDNADYYTIRSVAAPTMYAYNLKTADEDSKVAMKEAPAEGGLTDAYYWKISSFGEVAGNITPKGGDAFGWNKRGSYDGKNHIGFWNGGNGTVDNKWYVRLVEEEFIPSLHSVVGYPTKESLEEWRPYAQYISQKGINKLKNANWDIVLPEPGKFYRIKNDNESGYLSSGEGTGRTKFVAGIGEKASSIFYYGKNKKLCSYTTGLYLANSGGFVNYTNTVGEAAGTDFTFAKSAEWGKLAMYFKNNGADRSFYSKNAGDSNAGSGKQTGEYYRFTIEEVTWLPVEIIPSVGYATLYSPVELGFNNRVTAYTASLSEDKEWLELVEQKVVPANTGVVLTFEEDVEVEEENDKKYVYLPVQSTSVNNVTSDLAGTFETKSVTDVYTLQQNKSGEGVVFGQYTGTNVNGFKAYLVLPAGAGAISIRFEGSTDIENVEIRNEKSEMIFDLLGRRVEAITKGGIYIVNGKKVVIK